MNSYPNSIETVKFSRAHLGPANKFFLLEFALKLLVHEKLHKFEATKKSKFSEPKPVFDRLTNNVLIKSLIEPRVFHFHL